MKNTAPIIKTESDIKNLIADANNVKAMQALFEAIAFEQLITEIVENKQREILSFYKWNIAKVWVEKGREDMIILEPNRAFLLEDEDFKIYLAELEAFYYTDACPVKPKKAGCCPALEAQSFVRDIKVQIADLFAPYFGFGYDVICRNLKHYKQYYDLLLTLFASEVKAINYN